MSEQIVDMPTNRLALPSGGWATFRPAVKYGARKQLRRLAANIGAQVTLKGGDAQGASFSLDADKLADMSEAQEYFALCYLLTGWSYDLPLPTLQNLDPLDEIEIEDGEFLMAEAQRIVNPVDFGPTVDVDDRSTPTRPSLG